MNGFRIPTTLTMSHCIKFGKINAKEEEVFKGYNMLKVYIMKEYIKCIYR